MVADCYACTDVAVGVAARHRACEGDAGVVVGVATCHLAGSLLRLVGQLFFLSMVKVDRFSQLYTTFILCYCTMFVSMVQQFVLLKHIFVGTC